MDKAVGFNVGGKIGIARCQEHLSVCIFLTIGMFRLDEVVIGLGPVSYTHLTEEISGTKMEIVYNQTSRWEKERAMKIVEDLIQKNQKMDIIITQDDNSAMGAGMALQEAGLKDKIYVIGLGGSKEGLAAIKDGLIDGTTYMLSLIHICNVWMPC